MTWRPGRQKLRGRRRPDPFADIFGSDVVPMLAAAPGLRCVAIFEEMQRRHPELYSGLRRTMERRIAERADKEGWPAARFLAAVAEHEVAERNHRRIERHLAEAKLLPGKTLDSFEFEAVPMISKALVMAICAGDSWIDNGWCVMFTRNSDLVQRLQVARRELALEAAIAWLDRFDLLILDDFAYISKDQAETSALFEFVSARYERRLMLITANQPFGEWGRSSPIPL